MIGIVLGGVDIIEEEVFIVICVLVAVFVVEGVGVLLPPVEEVDAASSTVLDVRPAIRPSLWASR